MFHIIKFSNIVITYFYYRLFVAYGYHCQSMLQNFFHFVSRAWFFGKLSFSYIKLFKILSKYLWTMILIYILIFPCILVNCAETTMYSVHINICKATNFPMNFKLSRNIMWVQLLFRKFVRVLGMWEWIMDIQWAITYRNCIVIYKRHGVLYRFLHLFEHQFIKEIFLKVSSF